MKKLLIVFLVLTVFLAAAACANRRANEPAAQGRAENVNTAPPGVSHVFVESSDGTDDGVQRLIRSMYANGGLDFYALIASCDVVILKINAQWAERGGTNTDLIRGVIQAILDHPAGFTGEIIVADNGQAQFGSERRGGSLEWANANSADRRTSTMDVIRSFQGRGYRVTGVLWDNFTTVRVQKFSEGDMRDGFVVEDRVRATGLEISYPKFTTEFGTHVSFREGIWDAASQTYNSERLKVINMPVLKSHGLFQVTAAVKNYMGVPSDRLTNRRSHNSVGIGGMGTLMAYTRFPVLNILDMIWIGVERGPASSFATAMEKNLIAASVDPVALDFWASRDVLKPAVLALPGGRGPSMNPAGTTPGTFGHWLRLSMYELHKAGFHATMDEDKIVVFK